MISFVQLQNTNWWSFLFLHKQLLNYHFDASKCS